jgi:hypothetical protein
VDIPDSLTTSAVTSKGTTSPGTTSSIAASTAESSLRPSFRFTGITSPRCTRRRLRRTGTTARAMARTIRTLRRARTIGCRCPRPDEASYRE